jgi:large subunit ribosomal protein L25
MEQTVIQATKRQDVGSPGARRLRRQGLVPAVLYGHKLDTVHLTLPLKDVERLVHAHTHMVSLEIGGTVETALIKEIQYDSMGDHLLHVDLARVAMDQKVSVTVPVELHGLAKGLAAGGVLEHLLKDVQVQCLPGDIPERIRVEIAGLEVGAAIRLRDIVPPPGVEFLQDPEMRVVSIRAKLEEVAAPGLGEAEIPAEPELIRREKEAAAEEEGGKE